MPFSFHVLLFQVQSAPADSEKASNQALFIIAIMVVVASVGTVADKLFHITEFWTDDGRALPFWPTFVGLTVLATILAYPEIHDYFDAGHYASLDMKIETLQKQAMFEILHEPMNMCVAVDVQRKLDDSRAEAYDGLDDHDTAERVRAASPTPNPQCSPLPAETSNADDPSTRK